MTKSYESALEKEIEDSEPEMICCICNRGIDVQYTHDGEVNWTKGHNPEPVKSGPDDRCCSFCNSAVVIPERLRKHYEEVRKKKFVVGNH